MTREDTDASDPYKKKLCRSYVCDPAGTQDSVFLVECIIPSARRRNQRIVQAPRRSERLPPPRRRGQVSCWFMGCTALMGSSMMRQKIVGRTLRLRLMLYLMLLLIRGSVRAQHGRPDPTGPLSRHYALIHDAARRSLDIYSMTSSSADDFFLVSTGQRNNELSAVWFQETEDACFATFRGKTDPQGNERFDWIANMDLTRGYVTSKARPDQRCRVVAEYEKLYDVRRASYRLELEARLDSCVDDDKLVVLAGHGLGGSLALMVGVRYEQANPWIITFGQPPIFMPQAYGEHQAINSGDSRSRPCPLVNPNRYVPFINSHAYNTNRETDASLQRYDFLYYLNELIYGMIVYSRRDGSLLESDIVDISFPVELPCLVQATRHVRAFLQDDQSKGNMGSQFGSAYLLPSDVSPVSDNGNRATVRYFQSARRARAGAATDEPRVSYDSSTPIPVETSMLLTEPMLSNRSGFCNFIEDDTGLMTTHSMQVYYDKIVALEVGHTEDGFALGLRCEFRRECYPGANFLCDPDLKVCVDVEVSDSGPGSPNCVGFRAGCVASSQCCSGFACIVGQCQGCLGLMQNCASSGQCCTNKCKGMRMMKCKG